MKKVVDVVEKVVIEVVEKKVVVDVEKKVVVDVKKVVVVEVKKKVVVEVVVVIDVDDLFGGLVNFKNVLKSGFGVGVVVVGKGGGKKSGVLVGDISGYLG